MDKAKKKASRARSGDPKPLVYPRGTTATGAKVFRFMKEHKVNGNFRDFVLFAADQMYDNAGAFTIRREVAPGEDEVKTIALVHKAHLHLVIGAKAERFWNKKLKRRVNA